MANYTGYLEDFTHVVSPTAPSWAGECGTWINDNIGFVPDPVDGCLDINAASGTLTTNLPISFPNNAHIGNACNGYADVFYNRVLVEPTYIDMGSVVSQKTTPVTVFNAYLTPKFLGSIDQNNFDSGTALTAATGTPWPPSSFTALQEGTYNLAVDVAGPPNIEGDFTFNFTDAEDVQVEFIGSRIVLLPVCFKDKTVETLVWLTEIHEGYDGTEQRIRGRIKPRQQLKIRAYLDRWDNQLVENLLYGWRKRIWALPMWIEARPADSAVTEGDTVINVDTRFGDFRTDELAVIWESSRKFDVFQIGAMTDTSITMLRGANDDYANAMIMPVRSGRMLRDPKRTASGYDAVLSASFEITDNVDLPTSPSATQVNGEDFYDVEQGYEGSGLNEQYTERIDLLDNKTGVVDYFAPWSNPKLSREFDIILEGLEEIWEHREWLHRRGGKLRPFYMPTYEYNFRVCNTGMISNVVDVVDENYANQASARTNITVFMKDGTRTFNQITGTDTPTPGEVQLTLASPINELAEDIESIQFIGLKRLSSDRISFTWHQNNVAITQVPLVEIKP